MLIDTPFIDTPQTRLALQRMDAFRASTKELDSILPILGDKGVGKSRLIRHWIEQQQHAERHEHVFQPPPLLYVAARPSEKARNPYSRVNSVATCNLFSEIAYRLGRLRENLGGDLRQNRWFTPAGRHYTDTYLSSLYNFVRGELHTLGVSMMIIDQAEHLDDDSFMKIQHWYAQRERQFKIVLCWSMLPNATISETLRFAHGQIADKYLAPEVKVEPLTNTDLVQIIIPTVMQTLNPDYDHTTYFSKLFTLLVVDQVQGNWTSLRVLTQRLEAATERQGRKRMVLDEALLPMIFNEILIKKQRQRLDARLNSGSQSAEQIKDLA